MFNALGRRESAGYIHKSKFPLGTDFRAFHWVALIFKFVGSSAEFFGHFAEFIFGSTVETILCCR